MFWGLVGGTYTATAGRPLIQVKGLGGPKKAGHGFSPSRSDEAVHPCTRALRKAISADASGRELEDLLGGEAMPIVDHHHADRREPIEFGDSGRYCDGDGQSWRIPKCRIAHSATRTCRPRCALRGFAIAVTGLSRAPGPRSSPAVGTRFVRRRCHCDDARR
jgi:hypothetical protein